MTGSGAIVQRLSRIFSCTRGYCESPPFWWVKVLFTLAFSALWCFCILVCTDRCPEPRPMLFLRPWVRLSSALRWGYMSGILGLVGEMMTNIVWVESRAMAWPPFILFAYGFMGAWKR